MTDTLGSLEPIFSPRGVAVVGASRDRGSIGWALLHNLLMAELEGPIYPVNPHAEVIHSLTCYPSVAAVPDPLDLAVILVPARAVPAVVEQCVARGVRGLVVISAGFAEVDEAGAKAEAALRETVRKAGVRMIGPNCMGVINTDPDVRLDATFARVPARRGTVGFVSQSGALGVAILNVADTLGLGVTQFVSVGNKADVSGNDLLEHWEDDDATRVIAMYLESFGNPRRFTEIAKRVSRKKPILMVKSGRTEAGARAASSHTGALAGSDVTVSAFLDQCGVLRANTIEELFDTARALDRCPLPAGPRAAIVTNAGGPAIMATDALISLGLELATLAPATRETLAAFLPAAASLGNPVDMIASATATSYARTLAATLADPGVDLALVIYVTPLLADPLAVLEAASEAARATPSKPVLAVLMAEEAFYQRVRHRRDLLPVYRFPESAARALAQLQRYAAWRRRPADEAPATFDVDDRRVAALLAETEEGYVGAAAAFGVLEAYGIPCVPWRTVDDATGVAGVLEAAAALGYPVVLKASAPGLVHKRDVGAVAVDLRSPEELRAALEHMRARLAAAGQPPSGWLVQRLAATAGREVIFGVTTDPRLGPLLMVGLGGTYVEVLRDVRFLVPPITRTEALEALRRLRGFALLEGVRGEPPADLERLVETLARLDQLVRRHPRIVELDVNPFAAGAADDASATSSLALDVRIRVRPADG